MKKTYEDSLGVLILIKRAKMLGKDKLDSLPQKVLPPVHNAKNLDDAEKLMMTKMTELRQKMSELGPEIKKLSDQLEPYLSGTKQTQDMPRASKTN